MAQRKARIAVLVSGGGTNLQAIIDGEKSGVINSGKTVVVLSSAPDAYALERAKAAGIKALALDRKAGQESFEKALTEALEKERAELIVLAGFLSILSRDFTGRYPGRIINIHPSLIPSFCGAGFYGLKVHEAALARGVKISGATVHYVNEIPDGGEIIMQKAVRVYPSDSPQSLQKRIMRQAEQVILPKAVERICAKIVNGEENDYEQLRNQGS